MSTIPGYIFTKVLEWKISGEFSNIKKSIVIFAPHISYYDTLYGKLCFNELGLNIRFYQERTFLFPAEYFHEMVWICSGSRCGRRKCYL